MPNIKQNRWDLKHLIYSKLIHFSYVMGNRKIRRSKKFRFIKEAQGNNCHIRIN